MNVLLFCSLALLPQVLTIKCDEHCEACGDVADIGRISCDGTACTIQSNLTGQEDTDLQYLLDNNPIENKILTPDICRDKCQEQSDHEGDINCEFFHLQEAIGNDPKKATCSLQTTCPLSVSCDEVAKNCVSGQLGCTEDCKEIKPCSLKKVAWNHGYFHVICHDKAGEINIYLEDRNDIPHNTVCQTVRRCSTWADEDAEGQEHNEFYRKLAVYCDGTTGDDKGTWAVKPNTGSQVQSEAMITDEEGTITEQECSAQCEDITIDLSSQWWADIICENPLVNNVLKDPNSCILLCDNHLEKTIDCEFDIDGNKAWRNAEGQELKKEDITC